MKTIEQQNAVIAEFMGQFDGWDFKMFETGTWEFQTPEILRTLIPFKSNSKNTECFSTTIFKSYEVKFHTSWDWLMPVVEKIESLFDGNLCVKIYDKRCTVEMGTQYGLTTDIEVPDCFSGICDNKLEATYNAVCQFIEWYNANK